MRPGDWRLASGADNRYLFAISGAPAGVCEMCAFRLVWYVDDVFCLLALHAAINCLFCVAAGRCFLMSAVCCLVLGLSLFVLFVCVWIFDPCAWYLPNANSCVCVAQALLAVHVCLAA